MYICCSPLELLHADMDLVYTTAKQVINKQWSCFRDCLLIYYSYLDISLLHLHCVCMNNNCIYLEYYSNSSAVETLFQCTQHILGRYDQFLDQSRHECMPLHLLIREQDV